MNNSWYARRTSNWTGRTPRTLQDAFGPYTDPHVYESAETPVWSRLLYAVLCVCACVAIGVMLARGGR